MDLRPIAASPTSATANIEPVSAERDAVTRAPSVGRDVQRTHAAGRRAEITAPEGPPFWGEDGFGFDDLLDLVNPLQHLPLISTIYRAITGDQIAAGPRMLGHALFAGTPIGAAIGLISGAVEAVIEHNTGSDPGGLVVAWLSGGADSPTAAETPEPAAMLAEAAVTGETDIEGLPWLEAPRAEAPATSQATPVTLAAAEPAAGTADAAPARPGLSVAAWRQLTATDAARPQQSGDFTGMMTRALDKYQVLARSRASEPKHLDVSF